MNPLLDSAIDRTVVLGYSKLGYRLRSRHWSPADLEAMNGKVVLLSGATSGLGFAAALGFAQLGASVRLLARDSERGERTRGELIRRSGNDDIQVCLCDLSDLSSVRRFGAEFPAEELRLDVLVNNAGTLTSQAQLSVDGIELTFATNVVGPFLLTNLLFPLLRASAPARVINVSSGGMYGQKLKLEGELSGAKAYAQSKRAEVVLTQLWAQRWAASGVVVNAMHPGWVDTPGLREGLPGFHRLTGPILRDAQQGADTIVWLGASPSAANVSGLFWHDRRPRPLHLMRWTKESPQERELLWQRCTELSEA